MTAPTPPPPPPSDDLDELASAYLDGEATPGERARVEGDPALLARVGELRAVRTALSASVTPVDDGVREWSIDAALSEAVAGGDGRQGAAPVIAADQRRKRIGYAALGAVAAGLIAVVAVLATRDSDGGNRASAPTTTIVSNRDETAAPPGTIQSQAAGAATSAGGAATSAAASATTAAADDATTTATGPPSTVAGSATTISGGQTSTDAQASAPFLGAADDAAGVRAAIARAENAPRSAAASAVPAPNACTVPDAVLVGTISWRGAPALVFRGSTQATVVGTDTCQTLVVVPLA